MNNESLQRIFKITDDSGFIAIINPENYISFVHEDWNFEQLKTRFIEEMNKENLIIWATGAEEQWNIKILDRPSNSPSFKEFQKKIKVTNTQLCLINYEDLSIAAQFEDTRLPINRNLWFNLENGKYKATIRQLFDPENYEPSILEKIHFEIILQKVETDQIVSNVDGIFWLEVRL